MRCGGTIRGMKTAARIFRVVYNDSTPKPAYTAYANLERMLGDARYSKRFTFDQKRIHAYSFIIPGGEEIIAAWPTSKSMVVKWPAAGKVTID